MIFERKLTQIFPGVWRLVANNPSPMTGPGTNAYLVGGNQVVIVDPGPDRMSHLNNILGALQSLGAKAASVVITHHHADHAGCAEKLAARLAVPLISYGNPLLHGSEIYANGHTIVIQHTPGHIYTHLCLWLIERKLLFTGDLVAGQGTILIIPPDGNMAAYLDSLRAMKALAPTAILPGHGPVIDTPEVVLQDYIDHRLDREQQVLYWYGQGHTLAGDIAARIYVDRPEVIGIATLQVEAHLEKLSKENRL
jgi:glyoxylase-like metal-dependent hydrolase (beta-lactamase superfamily II)